VGIHAEVSAARAGITIPRDARALQDALRLLLDDRTLRAELAQNARRLAHEQYSHHLMTRRLLELYRSVLS
jgi:glycosyltransferase involved in cell wall biosynthesis